MPSGTSTVQGCTASIDGYSVLLLDTPGFDDTDRSDVEILSEIALYLNTLYLGGGQVVGIIYVHRITDTRMSGSSLKSLKMFEAICGLRASENITFVTTMWGKLGPSGAAIGEERMRELRTTFLTNMVRRGAQLQKHDGTVESARAILGRILKQNRPVVLDIQQEMGDKGLPLEDTTVGKILQDDLIDQQANHDAELKEIEQQMEDAKQSDDKSAIAILNEDGQRHREQLRELNYLRQQLRVNIEKLGTQRDPYFAARVQEARTIAAEDENDELRRQIRRTKQRVEQVLDDRDIEQVDFIEKEQALAYEGFRRRETLVRIEQRKLQKKMVRNQETFLEQLAGWVFAHPSMESERR